MASHVVETGLISSAVAPARRLPATFSRFWVAALFATDLAMFIVAASIGARIGFHHWNYPPSVQRFLIGQAGFIFLWLLIFWRLGLYRRTFALSIKDEFYYTVAALCIGSVPQLVLFTIFPMISTSRVTLMVAVGVSIVLVGSSRAAMHAARAAWAARRRRRVAIVGSIERLSSAAEAMDISDGDDSLYLAVDDMDESIQEIDLTRDGELESIEWFRHARAWGCDTLILTEMVPPSIMPHLLEAAARSQIRFAFAPPRIRCHAFSLTLQTDGQQALIVPSRLRACTPRAQLFKRLFDITIGSVALLILLAPMLLAALAVLIESGRPVFFKQERVGRGGKIFNILKLRSMRVDAEAESGAVWASEQDGRRTRVGALLRRLSIDEFPQIFNVLRGEMSLVGPRPERPVFVDLFRKTLPRYDERHLVSPGITGWSQVHMKRVLDPSDAAEKLSYDLQYVESWSPFLDISVLFQTAVEFLFHRAG